MLRKSTIGVSGACLCVLFAVRSARPADIPAFTPPFSVSDKALVAAADAGEVPTFQLRARVISSDGKEPQRKTFTFSLVGSTGLGVTPAKATDNAWTGRVTADSKRKNPLFWATVTDNGWTGWLNFDRKMADAYCRSHLALLYPRYPLHMYLVPRGLVPPARIEIEIRMKEDAPSTAYTVDLFSPGVAAEVGIFVWRDQEQQPHVMLRTEFDRPYWEYYKTIALPEEERPKLFPIGVQGAGFHNDSDRFDGLPNLARIGINSPWFPNPIPEKRDLVRTGGQHRIFGKFFRLSFDFIGKTWPMRLQARGNWPNLGWYVDPGERRPADTERWAQEMVGAYVKAGFQPEDISLFPHISDSSWFYPTMFQTLSESPLALQRFHAYIKAQGLTPQEVGAANWDQVLPLGRSKAIDLPSRRLFYWTIRFFAWDSARHFADMTRALEKVGGPDRPIMVGWSAPLDNRLYQPGPIDNNPDKTSPDAARGTHDWLEFGRLRGSTMLWGFFSFAQTHGSFRSANLRCAAEKGGVQFGGQISAGAAKDGDDLQRDVLAFIGSGGKGLRYLAPIGPTEHFPLACYREDPRVLKRIAEVNRVIGKAEELLWPGTRPRAQVAMLAPRSAPLWDKENSSPADYLAEEFHLYTALQHANVPADFVEEDDLSVKGLAPYKVLYVTEPNIPAEFQQGLLDWVQKGGTVVTVTGAATLDRYNDPCDILSKGLGISEQPRERAYITAPQASGSGTGVFGKFTAYGPRGTLTVPAKDGNPASFADGSPAIIERQVGSGRVVHFPWLPGWSYSRSPTTSEAIRRAITYPVETAKVVAPVTVDRAMIETPLLLSTKGGAVTLLNWGSAAQKEVKITVRAPFKVASVESVKQGKLTFNQTEEGVTCALPLGAADIVLLRP